MLKRGMNMLNNVYFKALGLELFKWMILNHWGFERNIEVIDKFEDDGRELINVIGMKQ